MSDVHGPQGTPGHWNIVGTADNDNLYGGKGDNHFDGGTGEDTVIYAGYASQYEVKFDAASQSYKIGNDTLKDVEYIQFSDARMTVEDASRMERTQYQYVDGSKNLQVTDTDFKNTLQGGDGDDTFTGNGGDDTLYGGKGEDAAVFRGNRADYDIVFDHGSGQFIVTDHHAGRDGQDHVRNVENLKFADTTIHFDFTNVGSNTPTDGDLAKVDGVIGEPYVPPPPSDNPAVGDILVGIWDEQSNMIIDAILFDGVYATTTSSTLSFALTASDASAEQIALTGVSAFEGASHGGYLLDLP